MPATGGACTPSTRPLALSVYSLANCGGTLSQSYANRPCAICGEPLPIPHHGSAIAHAECRPPRHRPYTNIDARCVVCDGWLPTPRPSAQKRHSTCKPERVRTTADGRRARALAHYGKVCVCCGYDREEGLVVASSAEPYRYRTVTYRALIAANFPTGYATYCGLCQLVRNRYTKCIVHGGADAA